MPDKGTVAVTTAVLGWGNGDRDTESTRLYATDKNNSPRWDSPAGRVVEQALREQGDTGEGDRYLIVRLGTRFVTDDEVAAAVSHVLAALRAPAGDVADQPGEDTPPF